jgi:hypothetical protein
MAYPLTLWASPTGAGNQALVQLTDAQRNAMIIDALSSILTKGNLTLDGNGNITLTTTDNPALVNILSGSVVTLRPGAGWSNMNLVVTISPGSGFSIASAGGNLDAGLVVGYTVLF